MAAIQRWTKANPPPKRRPNFTCCMFTAPAATLPGVDTDDLTPEQCGKLLAQLRPTLNYLHRVRARMDRRHVSSRDPLRLKVNAA